MDAGSRPSVTPGATTPSRRTPSVRRTTTHDFTRGAGLHGPVNVVAIGRDLRTDGVGRTAVLGASRLELTVDFSDGVITDLAAEPADPALASLVGATTFRGFRAALDQALPEERARGEVRGQLLDDLPMALLLSGRVLRAAGIGLARRDPRGPMPVDICAGWVADGTLMGGMTDFGPPLQAGPVADEIESDGDPLGWHEHGALPPNSTRRRRRLDVWRDGDVGSVECFFRDTHVDVNGIETVVHEYTVNANVDPNALTIVECDALPGSLPYPECPAAAESAHRLPGAPIAGLRGAVLTELTGPTTCTHLNDAFRSLEDVAHLLQSLPATA